MIVLAKSVVCVFDNSVRSSVDADVIVAGQVNGVTSGWTQTRPSFKQKHNRPAACPTASKNQDGRTACCNLAADMDRGTRPDLVHTCAPMCACVEERNGVGIRATASVSSALRILRDVHIIGLCDCA